MNGWGGRVAFVLALAGAACLVILVSGIAVAEARGVKVSASALDWLAGLIGAVLGASIVYMGRRRE